MMFIVFHGLVQCKKKNLLNSCKSIRGTLIYTLFNKD